MLEYLLGTELAQPIGDVLRTPDASLHVPALCDVEIAAGIRRALLNRTLTAGRSGEALEDYLDLPLTRHGHQSLLPSVLALRANVRAYDACYLALAESLTADLLTADERFARAARDHTGITVLP